MITLAQTSFLPGQVSTGLGHLRAPSQTHLKASPGKKDILIFINRNQTNDPPIKLNGLIKHVIKTNNTHFQSLIRFRATWLVLRRV